VRDVTDISGLISAALSAGSGLGDESAVGTGVAADGLIVVRAALPGRVVDLELDPAALRLPLPELVAELTAAVNAALAELQAGVSEVSLDPLNARLREIQQETTRRFSAFTESLLDAQAALDRRAR
jgi:hypothetical protein